MVSGLAVIPRSKLGRMRPADHRKEKGDEPVPPASMDWPGPTCPDARLSSHLTPLPREHRQGICLDTMRPRIFQLFHTSIQDEVNNNINNSCHLLSTYYMPGPVLKAFYKHSPTNPHKNPSGWE